nr:ABC transporter ATP-binding protein [Acetobacter malorum]
MTSRPLPSAGLSATHVTVQYGRRTVLQDVTAGPFMPGTVCALLGPNGSGKSTLMRAMAGLVPSSACVTLNGAELSRMSLTDRTARCLYLPQALPAAVHLPVLEALIAARQTAGRARAFFSLWRAGRRCHSVRAGKPHFIRHSTACNAGDGRTLWRPATTGRAGAGAQPQTASPAAG